jgi:hypothetical protein
VIQLIVTAKLKVEAIMNYEGQILACSWLHEVPDVQQGISGTQRSCELFGSL